MGIYLPNMEKMPRKGEMLVIFPDGTSYVCFNGMRERLAHTTAIHVPPHGRLIDKDVMCNECRRIAEEYDGIYPDCTYCPAHLAPTIIEAEEGE